jgi:N-acyl-phosphatidylethanolamine-hydrolysing phospholipase D
MSIEIGQRYGPFDLACIAIGAYSPRWYAPQTSPSIHRTHLSLSRCLGRFMSCVHCTPEDAVCVHLDVQSRRSVGMHWGTFVLTDEDVREPPRRLQAEVARRGLAPTAFTTLAIGETIVAD